MVSQSFRAGFYFNFTLFFYLAVLGLSSSMWDLVPQPGVEPRPPALGATVCPLRWDHRRPQLHHLPAWSLPHPKLFGCCISCMCILHTAPQEQSV